jgi:hypothetical protein
MDKSGFQVALTVAMLIGVGVVGWLSNTVVSDGERIARLEQGVVCMRH